MRKLVIVLLGLGTVAGFAAAFGRHHWRHHHGHHRAAFEQRVADVCVRASERTLQGKPVTPMPGRKSESVAP
jgi:hypothetical protein